LRISSQSIGDIFLIEPEFHFDDRGYFFESYREDLINNILNYEVNFIQENISKSSKGVLRGLHYQLEPFAQTKLIRVIEGKVLDVVVDIRKSSKTFGHHVALELSKDSNKQLLVPKGFAHGFVALSNTATILYKVDNYFAPEYERGIAFDDINLGIDWKISKKSINLSDSDKTYSPLEKTLDLFD
jgi:dTDP-4-dehydrorhamnose 3,5-epimerase